MSKPLKCVFVVFFKENLVILDHPSLFIKIKQGDTLRIEMHANGFPYPRYTWFKNPQDVVGMEENEDGILEIEDAQYVQIYTALCEMEVLSFYHK